MLSKSHRLAVLAFFLIAFASAQYLSADIFKATGLVLPIRTEANGGLVATSYTQTGQGTSDDVVYTNQDVGFDFNFFGTTVNAVNISTNGVFSLDSSFPYTPYDITNPNNKKIFAPFYADWKPDSTLKMTWGTANITVTKDDASTENRNAFVINWIDVPNYSTATRSDVQAALIDRSDTGPGNYDVEYNYGSVTWVVGTASGTKAALVGFSSGDGSANAYKLPQSLAEYGADHTEANRIHPFLDSPDLIWYDSVAGVTHNYTNKLHPERLISINNSQAYPDATSYPNSMEGRFVFISRDGSFVFGDASNPIWFGTF